MSGNLYQPYSKTAYPPGTAINLNCRHDKFGIVVKVQDRKNKFDDYILLVRGTNEDLGKVLYPVYWNS